MWNGGRRNSSPGRMVQQVVRNSDATGCRRRGEGGGTRGRDATSCVPTLWFPRCNKVSQYRQSERRRFRRRFGCRRQTGSDVEAGEYEQRVGRSKKNSLVEHQTGVETGEQKLRRSHRSGVCRPAAAGPRRDRPACPRSVGERWEFPRRPGASVRRGGEDLALLLLCLRRRRGGIENNNPLRSGTRHLQRVV